MQKRVLNYGCVAILTLVVSYAMTWSGLVARSPHTGLVVLDFDRDEKLTFTEDQTLLYGGHNEDWHFDISTFRLNPEQLRFGIGREHFHALIDPEFVSVTEADHFLQDSSNILVVGIENEVKVYPVSLLIRHEIVNDTVAGRPIFAAFCMLADLGAVYERTIAGREHTFALSGYTYSDPDLWDGRDAFVFWDRETESLWWPVTGKAVSGLMVDTPLKLLPQQFWAQTTWGEIKYEFRHAQVLTENQSMQPPESWPRFTTPPEEPYYPESEPVITIAPQWGENQFEKRNAAGSMSFRPME